jgi:hypothetical protein
VLSKPDSDIEEISDYDQEERKEEVGGRRKKKGKTKASEPDAVEEDELPAEVKRAKKRKATSEDEGVESVEIIEHPRARKGGRALSQGRNDVPAVASRGRPKPANSRAGSRLRSAKPMTEDDSAGNVESEEGQPAPKKKRKLLVFPTNDKTSALTSVWRSSSYFTMALLIPVLCQFGTNGLDIPTYLSPLKQDEPVPQRSLSIVGSLSNLMKRPFLR